MQQSIAFQSTRARYPQKKSAPPVLKEKKQKKAKANKENRTGINGRIKTGIPWNYRSISPIGSPTTQKKQKAYLKSILDNKWTFAMGPAGTSKTFLALYQALELIAKTDKFHKIYYVRANVGLDEERPSGELPGDKLAKMFGLVGPVLDNLGEFMDYSAALRFFELGIIEPLYLADLRGRSFHDCIVIVDEAQNATFKHLHTCMTRIGRGKLIIAGDPEQIDLKDPTKSGLRRIAWKTRHVNKVGLIRFYKEDIVRDPALIELNDAIYSKEEPPDSF